MEENLGKLYELLGWSSSPKSDVHRFVYYYKLFRKVLSLELTCNLLGKHLVKVAFL